MVATDRFRARWVHVESIKVFHRNLFKIGGLCFDSLLFPREAIYPLTHTHNMMNRP